MAMKDYQTFKKKLLRNKEVRSAYGELGFEFSLINALIERRIEKGLTQAELASKIGTRQSSIARFESGSYNPTISFLNKISESLGGKIEVVFDK